MGAAILSASVEYKGIATLVAAVGAVLTTALGQLNNRRNRQSTEAATEAKARAAADQRTAELESTLREGFSREFRQYADRLEHTVDRQDKLIAALRKQNEEQARHILACDMKNEELSLKVTSLLNEVARLRGQVEP